jgi:hypothetical protein
MDKKTRMARLQLMEFFREAQGGKGRRIPASRYAGRILRDMSIGASVPWEELRKVEGFGDCTEGAFLEFCSEMLLEF